MRVLKVKKNKLELQILALDRPNLIIGRAPNCDGVLWLKDAPRFSHLIEWVGDGTFDPDKGSWAIYDLSQSLVSEQTMPGAVPAGRSTQGIFLESGQSEKIGDFTFSISEDRLWESELKKGTLGEKVIQEFRATDFEGETDGSMAIETARFQVQDKILTDVYHVSAGRKRFKRYLRLPELKIKWQKPDQAILDFVRAPNRILSLRDGSEKKAEELMVGLGDLYSLEFDLYTIFIRLVPKVHVPKVFRFNFSDRFLWLAILIFGLGSLFVTWAKDWSSAPESKIENYAPRVVEIREAAPPPLPLPPKPPPPIIPPEPEIAKLTEEVKKTEEQKPLDTVSKKTKPTAAAKNRFKSPGEKKQVGLNSPAPKKDVNTVGLLSKLNKNNSTPSKTTSVEDLTQALQTDSAIGAEGTVSMVQAQGGQVDLNAKSKTTGNNINLDQASTTLQTDNNFDVNDSGPLARSDGLKGKWTLGTSKDGKAGKAGKKFSGQKGIKNGDGGQMSVSGGLTKDQVTQEIAKKRREIKTCFESALRIKSDLKGAVTYDWVIDPEGRVSSIKVVKSDLESSMVESCVMQVLRDIPFPKAENKMSTQVIYPFNFKAG